MPIDQLALPFMAILMLLAAMMGSSVYAGPPPRDADRHTVSQVPSESAMVDGRILRVDVKELEVAVLVKEVETLYQLTPSVQVTKDGKPAKLGAIATGDYAVLTLAKPGSALVTRIEAVSSR